MYSKGNAREPSLYHQQNRSCIPKPNLQDVRLLWLMVMVWEGGAMHSKGNARGPSVPLPSTKPFMHPKAELAGRQASVADRVRYQTRSPRSVR